MSALTRRITNGPARHIAGPAYDALVTAQLATQRLLDGSTSYQPDTSDLTAVIKTFERPRIVRRLVTSISRLYPDLAIIVVDDSAEPQPIAGTRSIILPHDSGVSAGRAAGLTAVETPLILLLDDDFVFWRYTDLAKALARMKGNPEIDILGGKVIDLPLLSTRTRKGRLFPTSATPVQPLGSRIDGLLVTDKVANFYLAHTDRLREVGWDPRIRRLDHADFFTRALGRLVTVEDPSFSVLHAKTPFDHEYMAKRMDVAADRAYLARKYAGK